MLERRVHPRLPRKRLLCFYPMAKRARGDDNWYPLPSRSAAADGRARPLGAKFSGRYPADHRRDRACPTGSGA